MLNGFNKFLLTLIVIVVALCIFVRADTSQPNYELFPEMKYSPAWATYEANPLFRNGRTQQTPIPGTIAQGQLPIGFEAGKEEALRAGQELKNELQTRLDELTAAVAGEKPSEEDKQKRDEARRALAESRARGEKQYRISCLCCHGAAGAGDGPVAKRGFPPPPSLTAGKSRSMKDGQLFHILTFGQTTMPSFADQLSPHERWDVVNYLRSMQATATPVKQPEQQPAKQPEKQASKQADKQPNKQPDKQTGKQTDKQSDK